VIGSGTAPVAVAERVIESAESPENPSWEIEDDRV
jgi:ATP-binding cassette subfamily B protein